MKKVKKTTEAREQAYYAILSDVSGDIYRNCTEYSKEFKTKIPSECLKILVDSIDEGSPISCDKWVDLIQSTRTSNTINKGNDKVRNIEVSFEIPEDGAHCFLCACETVIEHLMQIHDTIAEAIGCVEEED